ncbi:hypothetical protein QAD02_021812 [Eretmocerus hayati]|uniref:Uncharacterized protein n=1 Tax=Eretmocerus hayati TaxID=131215 RepID=A0ACC2PQY8_9HYME|nr:hypothetical protein QAD02_021812 [Eretmocerus hayati]
MLQSSGLYPRTKNHSRVLNTFMCHSPSVRLYMGRTDVRKNSQEENPPYFSKQIRENLESRMWATTAFPSTAEYNADLSMKKTVTDPSNTSIILFPGQGTVRVGCIREYMKFPRVKELFTIANEILGYNLMKICLNGPQKVLDRTEFNQPATTVCSLAALEKLLDERPRAIESCVAVAGYSVGELTALMFSGAMTYEDGLKLVAIRATAMQNASEISSQGMLSCYCTAASSTSKICKEAESWARDMGAPNPLCRYYK